MKKICLLMAVLAILMMLGSCNTPDPNPPDTDKENESSSSDVESQTTEQSPGKEPVTVNEHYYWSFDEMGTDGSVTDSSNQISGTAQGCKVVPDAKSGNSLLFQATQGGCVSFDTQITDVLKQTGAITVSFWYYSMSSFYQNADVFCLWMEDGKPGLCIELSSSNIVVSCRSHAKESVRTRTYACKGWGEWTYLSLSVDYNSQELHLYRNGVEIEASETTALKFGKRAYDPGEPMYEDTLGGFVGDYLNTKCFAGKIDEFYLFSKAVTASEINELYQKGRNVTTLSETDSSLYSKLQILTSAGSTVLSVNSNVVLYNGDRCYLVPEDAAATVIEQNGDYYAPLKFYETYCAKTFSDTELQALGVITSNGYQYISVQKYASQTGAKIHVTDKGRIVLGKISATLDSALLDFIDRYYSGELDLLPVPEVDVYSTRTEVQFSDVVSKNISLGSPSIVRLTNGNLLCSYDYNGTGYKPVNGGTSDSGICLSADNGATWTQIATIPRMMWGSLFCVEDTVYLVGRDTATAKLGIVKSVDGGYTWTTIAEGQIDRSVGSSHRAPTPVVISNGRIYIACEDSCDANGQALGVQSKRAYMMSASVTSDLLKASSWTKTNYVSFDTDWLDDSRYYGSSNTGLGFYEGNAVCGKDGTMYIVLRMDSDPSCGMACILKLSSDSKTLTYEKIVDLPVGKDKFAIRYDETSGKYIAIGNVKSAELVPWQRNVLAMYYSDDMVNWTYATTLISDNSLTMIENSIWNYGYQYPDFIISGNDIIMVVREASGNTTFFHNANYISFYTVKNFRDLLD